MQPISLHYSQHSLYPLLSQPACSSSSPIEVSRRCTHRTSSPSSATAAPTEPYPSSHQHRPHRQPQHRWEHRLPARNRQIFPLQPATGHGLPHQHRRDRASLIDCLWCFLGFAGDIVSHRRRGREEGMKLWLTPAWLRLQQRCVGPPVTVACGETHRHCSKAQKPSSVLFPQIPGGFGFFRGCFVICKLFNVILFSFLNFYNL